jgi:hypothetical protein
MSSGTVTLLGCTVEQNSGENYGVIYIAGASVCLDADTVAHVLNNTPNVIQGPYTLC